MSDNNASDWIYLLMALVAGGVSVIKSLSKKKVAPSRPQPREEVEEEEWTDEEEEWGAEPIIIEEYTDYYKNRAEAMKTELVKEGDYYNKKLAVSRTKPETSTELTEEEEDFQFDLKKAILYNEILHRKYD